MLASGFFHSVLPPPIPNCFVIRRVNILKGTLIERLYDLFTCKSKVIRTKGTKLGPHGNLQPLVKKSRTLPLDQCGIDVNCRSQD
jgi:hypothetical protein